MKVDLSKEKKELTMKQFHEIADLALDKAARVSAETINALKEIGCNAGIQSAYVDSYDAALAILTVAHLKTIIMLFGGMSDRPASVSAFEAGVALNKIIEFVFETQLLTTSIATKLAYQRRLEDLLPEYFKGLAEGFEEFGMEEIGI